MRFLLQDTWGSSRVALQLPIPGEHSRQRMCEQPITERRDRGLLISLIFGISLASACKNVTRDKIAVPPASNDTITRQLLPEPSGNAELDNLRRLALTASTEELSDQWIYFADVFATDYRTDPYLVTGIERLATQVIAYKDVERRHLRSRVLAQTIELGEAHLQQRLGHLVPKLRAVPAP